MDAIAMAALRDCAKAGTFLGQSSVSAFAGMANPKLGGAQRYMVQLCNSEWNKAGMGVRKLLAQQLRAMQLNAGILLPSLGGGRYDVTFAGIVGGWCKNQSARRN